MYGCDIDAVREIIPYRPATRLPGAPPFVQGLINLRGTIVTVLDLGTRLDPTRPPISETGVGGGRGAGGSIILVDHGTRVVGIAVDEVMDVQAIEQEPVEGGGRTLVVVGEGEAASRGGVVRGLGHLDDGIVVLLDIHVLVTQVLL